MRSYIQANSAIAVTRGVLATSWKGSPQLSNGRIKTREEPSIGVTQWHSAQASVAAAKQAQIDHLDVAA